MFIVLLTGTRNGKPHTESAGSFDSVDACIERARSQKASGYMGSFDQITGCRVLDENQKIVREGSI